MGIMVGSQKPKIMSGSNKVKSVYIGSTKVWSSLVSNAFVAITTDGKVYYSENKGVSWQFASNCPIKSVNGIAYGNGVYVVVGTSDTNSYYSSDLATWTRSNAFPNLTFNSESVAPSQYSYTNIVFYGGYFVTARNAQISNFDSDMGGSYREISDYYYSTNGINWTRANRTSTGYKASIDKIIVNGNNQLVSASENRYYGYNIAKTYGVVTTNPTTWLGGSSAGSDYYYIPSGNGVLSIPCTADDKLMFVQTRNYDDGSYAIVALGSDGYFHVGNRYSDGIVTPALCSYKHNNKWYVSFSGGQLEEVTTDYLTAVNKYTLSYPLNKVATDGSVSVAIATSAGVVGYSTNGTSFTFSQIAGTSIMKDIIYASE